MKRLAVIMIIIIIMQVFHTSLNRWYFTEWQQVSSGRQDSSKLIANLNHAVVWIFLIVLLISNSSSLLSKILWTIPSALITISITITFMFHSFFSSLTRSKYLFIFSLSLIFTLWSDGRAKSMSSQVLFSCL